MIVIVIFILVLFDILGEIYEQDVYCTNVNCGTT